VRVLPEAAHQLERLAVAFRGEQRCRLHPRVDPSVRQRQDLPDALDGRVEVRGEADGAQLGPRTAFVVRAQNGGPPVLVVTADEDAAFGIEGCRIHRLSPQERTVHAIAQQEQTLGRADQHGSRIAHARILVIPRNRFRT